jgi:hypothetical protein
MNQLWHVVRSVSLRANCNKKDTSVLTSRLKPAFTEVNKVTEHIFNKTFSDAQWHKQKLFMEQQGNRINITTLTNKTRSIHRQKKSTTQGRFAFPPPPSPYKFASRFIKNIGAFGITKINECIFCDILIVTHFAMIYDFRI